MFELFYLVPWPNYQEYMDLENFDSYSVVDVDGDGYFIQKDWLNEIIKDKQYNKQYNLD